MKQEFLQPVWNYNTHTDPLTNIHTLHLVLWDKGLCIAGYDIACTPLSVKVFSFAKAWDTDQVEAIFVNEPLVAGPQPVTHIWIADERNFLVPEALFSTETAALWMQQFHFVESSESVLYSTVAAPLPARVAFPVSNKLGAMFNKYFQEAALNAVTGPALQAPAPNGQSYHADIICLAGTMILSMYHKGTLINHQVCTFDSVEDIVCKIGGATAGAVPKAEDVAVHLSGYAPAISAIGSELQAYFPHAHIPGADADASFLFLNRLLSCVS
ncbi:DUF3822 family protein [Taibaiella chishuiensis]|uniref:Uncharacterized protein DUF3822 n=1 Tax=Taibaiella chishuiensis TaxID=1434707 RepID=A0A2P8D3X8_9BACT|nr:DUF3822 family protein [Taibaiella chishuiensis]PSK91920.1 uncharacterized protein DUF3822 [Taibaiella chishuiensis]